MYALSLALADMRDTIGDLKLGYVRNLVSGQEYTAIKSKGAFCNGNRLRPSNNSNIKMLGVELSQYSKGNLELNVKYLRMAEKIRALGSIALDLCYVASGAFDALIDVRDCIRTLDIAAGALILEESGGFITDLNGKNIYGLRIDPKTRLCFLAAGNTKIHNLLMETH
jgi:myo-inositol-1(or 4)-monophosphatase